ncbi:TonB-dependent receptor [Empedobacter brevis]|uniref:TonB-dependent receptor n=1 Tax=Empedobacter brevis TaxID=247 RepID=UPI0039AED634
MRLNSVKLLFVGAFALTASLSFAQVVEQTDSTKVQHDENVSLGETLIIGKGVIDLQDDRKTPIAATTISKEIIEQKAGGALDITQAFVNTPAVTVAGQGGGFGESRVVTRGFDQSNTAFLFNGQPINGMDNGSVYWSNWSGLADIASAVQIQRGLGSSKLAISSVGGTYNFVTKATDKKEGGFFNAGIGNNYFFKSTLGYNTGLINNKFGVSVMMSHWQGDGYNRGNAGQGQTYFLSVGYKPARNHTLNLMITGAPQWHDQNSSNTIDKYLTYGRKYNSNFGYLHGNEYNTRRNYYHKPVANLNWDWDINDKLSLSTVLYASWGRGGGSQPSGISNDPVSGLTNIQSVFDSQSINGGEAKGKIYSSINNHQWYGVVSNLNYKINDYFNFNVGVDARMYKGEHFQQLNDLLGGDYFTVKVNKQYSDYQINKLYSKNPWSALNGYAKHYNQKLGWDYDQKINYGGLFAQFEYSNRNVSAFFQGSVSNQTNERVDFFNYTVGNEKSEKIDKWGYNLKAGASYKIANDHQIFANAGFYSRQPYQNNIFMNFKNDVNPFAKNEEILGLEAGYKFKSRNFWANLNLYYTTWENRITSTSRFDEILQQFLYTVNRGVKQEHKGIELELNYKPIREITLTGFGSLGDWRYKGNSSTTVYTENQEIYTPEDTQNFNNLKVGGSAQTQFGLGVNYEFIKGLSVDADYRYNADLYSSQVTQVSTDTKNNGSGNLKLPDYSVMDAGITWHHNLTKKNKLTLRLNVNNVLNHIYISEARTNYQKDYKGANAYDGLNVNNQVYFGYGRTWNATVKFTF